MPPEHCHGYLDDPAAQSLPDGGPLAAGSYRPGDVEAGDPFPAPAPGAIGAGSALSVYDLDPNGTWQLFVVDDDALESGSMTGWRLDVTTTGLQPYPSVLTVSGAADTVTDVDVVLHGLSHTSPGDVDLLLVGPAGQQATILSDAGSDADISGITVTLDDEAATPVPTPVGAGSYQPTNTGGADPFPAPAPPATGTSALSVFDGTNPNGTWRLFVADDAAGDSGALAGGWSLRITADDTIAPTVASTTPTAGKKRVKRGADISATFAEPVRARTVNRYTVYLVRAGSTVKIRASVTFNAFRQRATIDPRRLLLPDTRYRAFVTTKVKDLAGNRLDQAPTRPGRQAKTWTFRTR